MIFANLVKLCEIADKYLNIMYQIDLKNKVDNLQP